MKRKLQTIYEYFSDYSEEQINDMLSYLSLEEKLIIQSRFGNNLHNPIPQDDWGEKNSKKYYGSIVPKMKRLLLKNSIAINTNEKNKQDGKLLGQLSELRTNDLSSRLLQLVKKQKTNREICECLGISINELYDELLKIKNKGIFYSKKYYSDGSIKYKYFSKKHGLEHTYYDQSRTIITDSKENEIKILLISDLHFGNILERIDLIDRAYNYCIKNDIHIILCGGDFIDGSFSKGSQKISDLYQQIDYFIKNYPHDDSILTFGVAGNHDLSALEKFSINIMEVCNNFRHDIVIGGYNNTEIRLKNDKIHLYHHVEGGKISQTKAPIILRGHSHKYTIGIIDNCLNITIPTLSNICSQMPSALELDLYMFKGYIADSVVKHLYFGEQDFLLSEASFNLLNKRNVKCKAIDNLEPYKQMKKLK